MAFAKIRTKTKTITEYVDELPWCFIVPEERKSMMKVEGFFSFHPKGGYYIKKTVPIESLNEGAEYG